MPAHEACVLLTLWFFCNFQQEGRALNGVCAEGGQVSDAEQVLNVVDQHLGKGDTKAAMKTLEAGVIFTKLFTV